MNRTRFPSEAFADASAPVLHPVPPLSRSIYTSLNSVGTRLRYRSSGGSSCLSPSGPFLFYFSASHLELNILLCSQPLLPREGSSVLLRGKNSRERGSLSLLFPLCVGMYGTRFFFLSRMDISGRSSSRRMVVLRLENYPSGRIGCGRWQHYRFSFFAAPFGSPFLPPACARCSEVFGSTAL